MITGTIKKAAVVAVLVALGIAPLVAAGDLHLHWRFDSPYEFGAIEWDASGHSIDGISTWARTRAGGGVRYAPGQGVFGGAGLLDGGRPGALHGVRGSMRSLKPIKLDEEWTVSVWVEPFQDRDRYYDILSFVQKTDGEWSRAFSLGQHGGRLRANLTLDGKDTLYQFGKPTKLQQGEWSHLLFVYPDDPVINYLKRCITSRPEDYTSKQVRTFGQESWIIAAPYVQDWKGPADLQEHLKQAARESGASLGYMSVFRGMMVGRSSWEAEASQLCFSPRSIRGGHSQIDRGHFRYNALGRVWVPFRGAEDNTVPDYNAGGRDPMATPYRQGPGSNARAPGPAP